MVVSRKDVESMTQRYYFLWRLSVRVLRDSFQRDLIRSTAGVVEELVENIGRWIAAVVEIFDVWSGVI